MNEGTHWVNFEFKKNLYLLNGTFQVPYNWACLGSIFDSFWTKNPKSLVTKLLELLVYLIFFKLENLNKYLVLLINHSKKKKDREEKMKRFPTYVSYFFINLQTFLIYAL